MPNRIVLFEDHRWQDFLPLVYIRPVWDLVCGQGSLRQRVELLLEQQDTDGSLELWCRPELAQVVQEGESAPVGRSESLPTLLLNARVWWQQLPEAPNAPAVGVIGTDGDVACIWADADLASRLTPECCLDRQQLNAALSGLPRIDVSDCATLFRWPWELVHHNEHALQYEARSMQHSLSGRVDAGSYILNEEHVSIGPGTRIKPCVVIDAEDGPVWIGSGVTISPHCMIQGPACIGDKTLLQPGATVHAGTTIGPRCKIGGEIEACIIQGFSNKQHDGFLGHSYIGSWVNIAADCINSDLKNTYGSVRVPINGVEVDSGEMFVGMLMGDYSKAGINVSFPTGAVVGFCSSVFRPISPKFVPSFAWLDAEEEQPFHMERGIEIARKVMARRQRELTPALERRFRAIAQETRRLEQTGEPFADAG